VSVSVWGRVNVRVCLCRVCVCLSVVCVGV
jgi:hypothetical protein